MTFNSEWMSARRDDDDEYFDKEDKEGRTFAEIAIDVTAKWIYDALLELLPDLFSEVFYEARSREVQRLLEHGEDISESAKDVLKHRMRRRRYYYS